MLQDQVSLRLGDKAYTWLVESSIAKHTRHSLLLSKASPLQRRNVKGPVGTLIPMTLPRLTICGQKVV